jgi:rhodanese-related sulfurtransferase
MENRRISASAAREKMRDGSAIILDVRTSGEYAKGRIPGAILLPDFDVREKAQSVLPNKDALILVYCRSGIRSHGAVCDLVSMDYTNVYDCGGINSWPYDIIKE